MLFTPGSPRTTLVDWVRFKQGYCECGPNSKPHFGLLRLDGALDTLGKHHRILLPTSSPHPKPQNPQACIQSMRRGVGNNIAYSTFPETADQIQSGAESPQSIGF